MPPALEAWSLNWTVKEILDFFFLNKDHALFCEQINNKSRHCLKAQFRFHYSYKVPPDHFCLWGCPLLDSRGDGRAEEFLGSESHMVRRPFSCCLRLGYHLAYAVSLYLPNQITGFLKVRVSYFSLIVSTSKVSHCVFTEDMFSEDHGNGRLLFSLAGTKSSWLRWWDRQSHTQSEASRWVGYPLLFQGHPPGLVNRTSSNLQRGLVGREKERQLPRRWLTPSCTIRRAFVKTVWSPCCSPHGT